MSISLPTSWHRGKTIDPKDLRCFPRTSKTHGRVFFHGTRSSQEKYREYDVPKDTPLSDIVRYFQIGSHGAESYGFDVEATVELVAALAEELVEIVPGHVLSASPACLRIRFCYQLDDDDLEDMEEVFDGVDAVQAGLEGYISEWDGQGLLFERAKDENLICLWWD